MNRIVMKLRTGFWLLLLATLAYAQFMKQAVRPITTKDIVAYELAGTPQRATHLLEQLSKTDQVTPLRRSFYLDFGFLLLYGFTLFVGCRYAASLVLQAGGPVRVAHLGDGLAWLGMVALVADMVENLALLYQLPPAYPTAAAAGLAWIMALLKFGCIGLTITGALTLFTYYGIRKITFSASQ